MSRRVLLVFGTRPEAIKMAPVVHALRNTPAFEVQVCVTGQHRQMLDQVLGLFEIQPDHDLAVMQPGQSLTDVTTAILRGMEPVLKAVQPSITLVHGDTATTFAAALASFYQQTPVGHIEAGLRTGQRYSPFPEELNRKLTCALSDYHFAPTSAAQENLLREGVAPEKVVVTGNTVIDALMWVHKRLQQDQKLSAALNAQFDFLGLGHKLVLVTSHRRENFGSGIAALCQALLTVANRGDATVVYPVHLNPNVAGPVQAALGGHPRIRLIAPQEYLPFVMLMTHADVILTDSGGIQEEAPSLGKPVLVMREVTERTEAVQAGTVRLVGTESGTIAEHVHRVLDDPAFAASFSSSVNPYGDGQASARIVQSLETWL